MPKPPKSNPDQAVSEALEATALHLPTTRSLPSWAGSLSPRPITRDELLTYINAFDVVMGIPEYTLTRLPFWQRLFRSEKNDIIPNGSYVQRHVLYLTPTDFNFYMAARKIKDNTVAIKKEESN